MVALPNAEFHQLVPLLREQGFSESRERRLSDWAAYTQAQVDEVAGTRDALADRALAEFNIPVQFPPRWTLGEGSTIIRHLADTISHLTDDGIVYGDFRPYVMARGTLEESLARWTTRYLGKLGTSPTLDLNDSDTCKSLRRILNSLFAAAMQDHARDYAPDRQASVRCKGKKPPERGGRPAVCSTLRP